MKGDIINLDIDKCFGWYVRVDDVNTHAVSLSIFNVMGYGGNNTPLFGKGDPDSVEDLTENLSEAAQFASCMLKWDACNHWYFNVQNDCMIHLCGLKNLDRFLKMIKDVTMLGKQLISDIDIHEWEVE